MTKILTSKKLICATVLLLLAGVALSSILYKERFLRLIIPERFRTDLWELELANVEEIDDTIMHMEFLRYLRGQDILKTSVEKKGFTLGNTWHFYNGNTYHINDSYKPSSESAPNTKLLTISPSGKSIAISRQKKYPRKYHRVLYVGSDMNNPDSYRNVCFDPDGWDVKKNSFTFNPHDQNQKHKWFCVFSNHDSPIPKSSFFSKQEWVVVDGIKHKKYAAIKSPQFSPNGKHIGYIGVEKGKGWILVVDGKEKGIHFTDLVWKLHSAQVENDTIWFYTVADDNSNMRLCYGDKISNPYKLILNPLVSTNGKHIVYIGVRSKNPLMQIVHDEKVIDVDPERGVKVLEMSPDGTKVSYITYNNELGAKPTKYELWINGEKIATHDIIQDLQFSPDGKHYAYIAGNSINPTSEKETLSDRNMTAPATWSVYIDNEKTPLNLDYISSLTYGANNQLAYVGCDKSNNYFVVNGEIVKRLYDIYHDNRQKHIHADEYCFRIIATVDNDSIKMMEWYYRD